MCNGSYENRESKWALRGCYSIKPGRDKCLKSLTNIFNNILFKDKLPEEWMLSSLVPIFRGKGILLIQTLTGNKIV